MVKKYDVKWPRGVLVPDDNELADRVFLAGLELARSTGIYCVDTKRRMVFSQDELDEVITDSPSKVVIGVGEDATAIEARRPDEDSRVAVCGGAYGIPVREHMFVPIMLSYAQEPQIDFIDNASLVSTYGRPIRARSPWEAVACWQEVDLSFEVVRRAGRPGMAIGCAENSPTAIGELSSTSIGGFRPTDWHHAALVSELKTTYEQLTKAVHFARTGSHIHTFANPIYGGYAGGADGMAVTIVASLIMMQAVYFGCTVNNGPTHAMLSCDTHPAMIPGIAVALQGMNRNTRLLTTAFARTAGGPGTTSVLYETAALAIAAVSSGIALMEGVQSAVGTHQEHCSGLEARFTAQVTHAAEKLTRKQADPIVGQLAAKYADGLKSQPIGKPFEEVYDVATLKPLPGWQGTYERVCDELAEMGLEIRAHCLSKTTSLSEG
ncbi:MAG: monomethylamine:corrinoid methyltransferase [Chloroflexi bacterium]|nr:monomethylamine:corrinoid methyltransferase [Chloroflexota bacterium]